MNLSLAPRRPEAILGEYQHRFQIYARFATEMTSLLQRLIEPTASAIHSITGRPKTAESLSLKLQRHPSAYQSLDEITDLAGIRLITYFADDVDRIAELVQEEFEVDTDNSVDKRAILDPDRFGYLSVHYVVSLGESRIDLPEYRRFRDLKAEIQIRSILQHSWAEIHHDLGYKTRNAVPRQAQRAFSRIAGLLELADQEFSRLRDTLHGYRAALDSDIQVSPGEVTIDADSLDRFIRASPLVARIDVRWPRLLQSSWIGLYYLVLPQATPTTFSCLT
ncbi:MAG TPA: hypothetical protein VGS57_02075 [Thermoanaerobaculia bacterium]|jgi:ppGpp synthetase/RelA/SpoT-type nucleotidyltranferase|nr:hypothetical protein [Thermoanaerobaculia bacterium]